MTQYRLLGAGDIIQEGDEWWNVDTWVPYEAAFGTSIADTKAPSRRAIPDAVSIESPEDWVVQDRVPARTGIDQAWWQYDNYDENIKKAFWPVFEGSFASSRKHGYRDNTSKMTLHVRCRRKDLPPIPEPPKTNKVVLKEHVERYGTSYRIEWFNETTGFVKAGFVMPDETWPTGNEIEVEVPV